MTTTSKNEPYTVVMREGLTNEPSRNIVKQVWAPTPKQAQDKAINDHKTSYLVAVFRGHPEECDSGDDEPFEYGAPAISTGQRMTFEDLTEGNLGSNTVLLSGYLDREPAAFIALVEPQGEEFLIAPIAVLMNPLIEKLARDPTGEPLQNLQEAETQTNIGGHDA